LSSGHAGVVISNVCFQESTFFVEAVDLGELERLVVEKSAGPPWHLSHITVKKGLFAPTEDVFHYDRYATNDNRTKKLIF